MLVPAPRNGRDLLEALRLYDADTGIAKFLDRLDVVEMSPRQVFWCVFGRLPSAPGARPRPGYDPRIHLKTLLQGEQFQKRLMARVLESYAEKRRMLFVHVPKCAGADLNSMLTKRYPPFSFRLIDRNWTTSEKMLISLKRLVYELANSDRIYVHGHVKLQFFISNGMVRFGDETFAIVRRPVDRVISAVNYILTRFSRNPELKAVDIGGWLRFVAYEKVKSAIQSGDYRDVGNEILHAPGLIERNAICQYLGEGTAESALDLCARADVEITHVDCYEKWLRQRWDIASSRRNNASRPLVSLEVLGSEARRRVEFLTEEDRVFVEQVERKLQENGKCSVMGTQLGA